MFLHIFSKVLNISSTMTSPALLGDKVFGGYYLQGFDVYLHQKVNTENCTKLSAKAIFYLDSSIIQGQFWPRADMAALGQSEKIILEKVLLDNFENRPNNDDNL